MYLHLIPRLFINPHDTSDNVLVELIDVKLPKLGVSLEANREIRTCQPFPNKHYLSVMRNKGRKAIQGFIIKTKSNVSDFNCITRWRVVTNNKEEILIHTVNYHVLNIPNDGNELFISEDQCMWLGYMDSPFKDKTPKKCVYKKQPFMMIFESCESYRNSFSSQVVNHDGLIVERVQCFDVPTIELERLELLNDRNPKLEDAFDALV